MADLNFQIRYLGNDADRGLLPAHLGAQSIEGMTWSLAVLGNYIASGKLRRRGVLDDRIRFYIKPAIKGSYITDVVGVIADPNNLFITSILGSYTVSTATNLINGFFSYAYRKVCGVEDHDEEVALKLLNRLPSGDVEAALDAIEPSVKRAHYVVGAGATEIALKHGSQTLVRMDNETRAYVNESIRSDHAVEKVARVGALNVNSGNGRVFLPDLQKTTPFSVVKEPDPGTYAALSYSLNRYARGLPCDVHLVCREVISLDGRIKRLVVIGATADP